MIELDKLTTTIIVGIGFLCLISLAFQAYTNLATGYECLQYGGEYNPYTCVVDGISCRGPSGSWTCKQSNATSVWTNLDDALLEVKNE